MKSLFELIYSRHDYMLKIGETPEIGECIRYNSWTDDEHIQITRFENNKFYGIRYSHSHPDGSIEEGFPTHYNFNGWVIIAKPINPIYGRAYRQDEIAIQFNL